MFSFKNTVLDCYHNDLPLIYNQEFRIGIKKFHKLKEIIFKITTFKNKYVNIG